MISGDTMRIAPTLYVETIEFAFFKMRDAFGEIARAQTTLVETQRRIGGEMIHLREVVTQSIQELHEAS